MLKRYRYLVFIVHNARLIAGAVVVKLMAAETRNAGLEAAAFGEAISLAISLGVHREDVKSRSSLAYRANYLSTDLSRPQSVNIICH